MEDNLKFSDKWTLKGKINEELTYLFKYVMTETKEFLNIELGDNHLQKFHLRRNIIGYMVGNHILWLCLCVAVKLNFRPYNR